MDLWWSGKHRHHGGNTEAVSAPDGWPLWTSNVRPGREHDTAAARADPEPTVDQRANNALHGALRCLGECVHSLLTTPYTVLRRHRNCPWRLGRITAAALVLLHHENHRAA